MKYALRKKAKKRQWDPRMLNGHPDVVSSLRPVIMRAVARNLDVTSTTDGRHSKNSYHYVKRAVDFGSNKGFRPWALLKLLAFQRYEHTYHGREYAELYGPSNRANRKYGNPVRLREGSSLETSHDNHVHIAI